MSRMPAKIDLAELEKLAAMQCTDEEIAAWFGVNVRTIERKRKNPAFADTIQRGKAKGKISLRRSQLKLVDQGNPAMAIWLGKQYLGQTDEIKHAINGSLTSYLSVILPRAEQTATARLGAQPLIDSGEAEDVEIEATDYETVSESE